MKRLEELKEKKYLPKYKELYKYLYSQDIDEIKDYYPDENADEEYKKVFALMIVLKNDNRKEEIRINHFLRKYLITIETPDYEKEENYLYHKKEEYLFSSLPKLIAQLDIILKDYTKRD